MTNAELIAIKWLQTTKVSCNIYRCFSPYFLELLDNGFQEDLLLHLPPDTFEFYEATKSFMSCTISEFVQAIANGIEKRKNAPN